ncbi:MAG: thioredoxin family protein [Blastocatellia bacterium]|nr:thioredoxin family protein [Blastocatellia bacterium]
MKKIEMLLDRDEFVVTFDAAKADAKRLIATIKNAGYTAQVVSGDANESIAANAHAMLPSGFALLDNALARANAENKLIVLDFFAEWCAPCQRMEKTTFVDARVANLLARTVVVRIDTDQHADIAAQMGVVGLPDIRFVKPDGSIIRQLRGYVDAESLVKELEQALRFGETK